MGQYNRLGKRRATGAWQWLVVGFFPGLLCGSLIIFAMLFTGFLDGFSAQPEVVEITAPPVQIVQVVTSTPDPAATEAVMVVTATPDENAVAQSETTSDENTDTGDETTSDTTDTQDTGTSAIVQPSLTPFTAANTAVAVNSDTNTTDNADAQAAAETEAVQPTPVPQSNPASADTTGGAGIPAQLAAIAGNLVQVSGGQFTMGADQLEIIQAVESCVNRDGGLCQVSYGDDSRPQVQVQLDTFWMEQNEVTFEQYVAFLNYQNSQGLRHTGGCSNLLCIQTQNERPNAAVIAWDGANYFVPANFQAVLNHPAYGVTWYGAQAYCNALGRRLPTEAEWEYAARSGGNTVIYPWGDSWSLELANVRIPAIEGSGGATEAVDSRIGGVNSLGLTHMAGNVAEWVFDLYDPVYYQTLSQQQQATGQPVVNPQGPLGGTQRVLRGGSFDTPPFFARTVHRQAWFPAPEDDNGDFPLWVGFRCASDTGPQTNTPNAGSPVDPASLQATIPASGSTDTNAQPTLAAPPATESSESESGTDEDDRG